ncbi:MAG: pentapeptide repeat-containing protein, partial [Xenococcus sp. (in: cyanobacteria)]
MKTKYQDQVIPLIIVNKLYHFFERKYISLEDNIQGEHTSNTVIPIHLEEVAQKVIKPSEGLNLSLKSELTENIISSNNQTKNYPKYLGMFLIIPLIGTAMVGYILVKEIKLNADIKLIQNCKNQEYCYGRIEAIERLVIAKKNLRSFNLDNAFLSSANLSSANLDHAFLSSANLNSAFLRSANLDHAFLSSANLK